jgi:hypothetical protein
MQHLALHPDPSRRSRQLQQIVGTPELVGEIELGARVFANTQSSGPSNTIASLLLDCDVRGDVVVLGADEVPVDVVH